MKKKRNAAQTVFQGKVVVTECDNGNYYLNSVEQYDYYENEWTYLAYKIEIRSEHAAVIMGNKLFVLAGTKLQVVKYLTLYKLWNISRYFTTLKSSMEILAPRNCISTLFVLVKVLW